MSTQGNTNEAEIESIKESLNALITAGTTFDIDALEKIYHDDLQVTMIDVEGNVNNADKSAFKGIFEAKKKEGAAPLNTWSKLHQISVEGDKAHVLLSRKVSLGDAEQDITLSIDWQKNDETWQVMREVIFIQP